MIGEIASKIRAVTQPADVLVGEVFFLRTLFHPRCIQRGWFGACKALEP